MTGADSAPSERRRRGRILGFVGIALVVVAVVLVLMGLASHVVSGDESDAITYLTVVALVFGDALFPILPGESTLDAACVLAAAGKLSLTVVIICGAVGAIVGDSTLYWLARLCAKSENAVGRWLRNAGEGKAGAKVVRLLDQYGNVFLLFGRYVPGLRFALNVTLGAIVKMPYRRFLFWSGLSGALWSLTVCLSAYFISSALVGYPIVSLVLSFLFGTALIGGGAWLQSRLSKGRSGSVEPTPLPE